MKILVDTHIFLWSFFEPDKIPEIIKKELLNEDNYIYYSQASLWKISTKLGLGKLILVGMNPEYLYKEISNNYYKFKKIENKELISFYKLSIEHRDSFDRIMIWQCICSDFVFASIDAKITCYAKYGLRLLS